MKKHYFANPKAIGFLALLTCGALVGCETTQALGRAQVQQDTDTCADFGTRYGSREHTDCMLIQQQRRDNQTIDALEKQRLSAEIARNNVEMVQRMRCEKEAKRDREEGRRPRPCR